MDKSKIKGIFILLVLFVLIIIAIFRNYIFTTKPSFVSNALNISDTPINSVLKNLASCDKLEISYMHKGAEAQPIFQIDDKNKIKNFLNLLKTNTYKQTDANTIDSPYFMSVKIFKNNENKMEFFIVNNLLEINKLTYTCLDKDAAFYCQQELGLYDKEVKSEK